MDKLISRVASQRFAELVLDIEPRLRVVVVKDTELVEPVFQLGGHDRERCFWIALAGLKNSDSHFCLRAAWTQDGKPYSRVREHVIGPPIPSSGIADLRDEHQLSGIAAESALQHELWLGFVPDDLAQRAAAEFLASAEGRSVLEVHQAGEMKLKSPRSPTDVEASVKIATVTNAGTWTGLMQIRPLSETEILAVVAPVVERAVGIFRSFGLRFLWERVGGLAESAQGI